jgi:hypothetical protein
MDTGLETAAYSNCPLTVLDCRYRTWMSIRTSDERDSFLKSYPEVPATHADDLCGFKIAN